MAGISLVNATPSLQNKYKTFQGQKFDDDLGLNYYGFKWRNHDPQIGRFIEVDPLSEDYEYNSTYAFSENKVTGHVELEGAEAIPFPLPLPLPGNPSSYGEDKELTKEIDRGLDKIQEGVKAAFRALVRVMQNGGTNNSMTQISERENQDIFRHATGAKNNTSNAKGASQSQSSASALNPNGSKGKPDHQEKVKQLAEKAGAENPGKEVVQERKIRVEGSNRRPDVQVVDPKTGKTVKVYEAERRPNSQRNIKREEEYKKLNITNETHKVGN